MKTLRALLLGLVLVATLTACGGDDDDDSSDTHHRGVDHHDAQRGGEQGGHRDAP